jgi:segregation and condensation protein B
MMLFQDTEIAALEALLFVAKEPLSMMKIAELLEIPVDHVPEFLQVLRDRYEDSASGLELIELEQGFRLGTKPELAGYIEVLYKQPSQVLSNAALEVLSIIAYKQPITRGEVDFIRGVQSDRALATLVERGLVKDLGRKEGPGRPILYGTTEDFLIHFGLKSIQDLPPLEHTAEEEEASTYFEEEQSENV